MTVCENAALTAGPLAGGALAECTQIITTGRFAGRVLPSVRTTLTVVAFVAISTGVSSAKPAGGAATAAICKDSQLALALDALVPATGGVQDTGTIVTPGWAGILLQQLTPCNCID